MASSVIAILLFHLWWFDMPELQEQQHVNSSARHRSPAAKHDLYHPKPISDGNGNLISLVTARLMRCIRHLERYTISLTL